MRSKKGKWSEKYDHCIKCGTDKIPHGGKGLCRNCYMQEYNNEHPEYRQKVNKRYREANLDKLSIYNRNYRKSNKNEIKKYHKQYYQDHKIRMFLIHRNWKLNNPGKYLIYQKHYRNTEHGKQYYKLQTEKRRAKKTEIDFWTNEMNNRWEWMLDTTEGYCPRCGEPFDNKSHKLTMDHIIPIIPRPGDPQGIHHIDNVQILCAKCNGRKSNKLCD